MSSRFQIIFISLIITFSLANYNCSGDKQKNVQILEHKSQQEKSIANYNCSGDKQKNAQILEQKSQQEKSITLTVSGISCHACVNAIKRTLKAVDGIVDVKIDLDKEKKNVMVSFNPDVITVEQIKIAINGTGKHVIDSEQDED